MAILNALPSQIALLDTNGVILTVNEAWRRFATANVLQSEDFFVGQNYLCVCESAHGDCAQEAQAVANGIRSVLEGRQDQFSLEYPCHSPTEKHWYRLMVTPLSENGRTGAVVMHMDITERKLAEESLQASEASLLHAQSIARIGNWDWNIGTDELYWSAQVFRLFGLEPSGTKVNYQTFLEGVHPEDRERVDEAVQASLAGAPHDIQHRVLRPDDTVRWIHGQGVVIRDASGVALSMSGTVQDITELKLAEIALAEKTRALLLLSRCNEALIRSETEMKLLESICQSAVDLGGFQRAWVGFAKDDADKTILPKAHAGVDDGYFEEITISWAEDSPNGQGPAGKTIRSGQPTVIPDLEADENFLPWFKIVQARGIRGVICLPLNDATRTFGVLGLHLPDVRHPQPDEMRVLQELADNMAFGITSIRARHAQQRMQTALVNVAAAVSATTGNQFFEQLTNNMAEALGAQASFVAEFMPDEPLRARTVAAVVDGQITDNFDYVIEGTPCENLMTSETCIISEQVAQKFARSPCLAELRAQSYVGLRLDSSTGKFLGLLFVLFREPLQDPDFVVATLHIFAARAAAELERQETDTRLREQAELLDRANDAIFVHRLDHTILYWNQGAERLYGWSEEEAVGRDIRELIYRDADALDIAFDTLMESGDSGREIEHLTKAGTVVIVERRCSLVSDEKGNPKSILSINTDITERKKIEAQYLRAQRMESIGTLAGGIAHDLNNVLTPIMMSIELLKMEEKNTERLDILSIIESSAKRGADMVKQVLSFARGVEGLQTEVSIRPLIEEIKKVVHETFYKNIELRTNIAPNLWLVRGDPTQLHQVLINLCVNARDAMPDGGTLTLTATNLILDEQYAGMNIDAKPGHHICIQVEDSGEGMPPEIIERIFEPFFTTKELGKGTGMGLSTSIAIIKKHGGFIRVYSEVGMGSRFHVYLPAYIGTDNAENDAVSVVLPRGKGELVLVVDDEVAVREITRQTLETFGYRVVLAADGVEATSIYAERRKEIAIVLTDMMMPLMDGPTMIKVLLKLDPEVRIIAASGLSANGMVAKAQSNGIRHFIPKPYTAETLLKTLREALED